MVIFLRKISHKQPEEKEDDDKSMSLLLQQMNELTKTVDYKIGQSTEQMSTAVRSQFGESQRLIKEINKQVGDQLMNVERSLTKSTETSKQVLSITDQLRNLEKVLKHQKQRGNLGEMSLQLVLENMLPPDAFDLQHHFSDGDIVDAMIHTKEGGICVDAKFSLDNYNRLINEEDEYRREEIEREFTKDLKKRIDETAKYIKPKEKTLPFAFMYIPAEGIYYDLLVNEVGSVKANTRSLIDYAYNEKNVIIVSPTTFTAYLQSVLYGFNAYKIEKSAVAIRSNVEKLGKHIKAYDQFMNSLGKSLGTTVNHYNKAHKELKKIDKDVLKIAGESPEVEELLLEQPLQDEE